MNINQLYAFTAVYETGNFSESARKLKLTQSAITQLIHSLEKDLDTLLFIRSKRPITPTQNGRMYYDYAKKIIELHEEAMTQINKATNHFTLAYRFGSTSILSRFLLSNPNERPHSIESLSLDDFNSVANWKENYLYFVRKDIIKNKNTHYTPAHVSKVYAAVSSDSALAQKKAITVEDLEGERILLPKSSVRTIVAQKVSSLTKDNPNIQIIEKDNSFEQSLHYVSLYQYISFCTEEFRRDFERVKYIEFTSIQPFEYGFACVGTPSSDMKAFIKAFKQWNTENKYRT